MASYAKSIADAVVTIAAGVTGAPSLVEYRKENTLHPRESNSAVIVTVEREAPNGRAFGGTIFKDYYLILGVYRQLSTPGDITSNVDVNPAYVLKCKQALDLASLSGVSVVRDVDLVENDEWEHQPFRTGMEVSRFGLLVRTNEPQNG